ncbi:DNA polymerase III subunit delta [Persephonella sp.]
MAEKSIVQLIKSFNPDSLKPVVLVYGGEEFLKKQLVEKIKAAGEIHILWGDELTYPQLKEVFSSSSLFSEGNTAVILFFEAFVSKLSKEEIKDFGEFVKNIALPDRLFLFLKGEKIPAREPFKSLKGNADVVISAPLTPKAFYISVKNKIEKAGKKIDEDTLKYLVGKLKNDLYYAKQEIEKLLTYIGDKGTVEKEDVNAVVVPEPRENVFTFLDRFFAKDISALRIYRQLVNSTHHPFEIQSLLLGQINRLLLFKTLLEKGKSPEAAFSQMNVKHPAMKGSIQKQASYVTKRQLVDMIKELYTLEKEQKVNFADVYKSSEEFILKRVLG